jgi:hypothetical protein
MQYTSEQVALMTDDEINAALASKILGKHITVEIVKNLIGLVGECFDYCNDWNTIAPLASKYNLILDFKNSDAWQEGSDGYYFKADKPQRALAGLLLTMELEGE